MQMEDVSAVKMYSTATIINISIQVIEKVQVILQCDSINIRLNRRL